VIGKRLSKDQLGVMRLLLGRVLDVDFDSCVLCISSTYSYIVKLAYIDIGELSDFTSH